MGSVLHRRIVFDFHCNNKHISAEIQIGGVCRLSTASSERISHAEVERRVAPLEVVDPPLAGRIVGIVQLNTPVQAQHGELDVEPDAEAGVESQLFVEVADVEDRFGRILLGAVSHEPDVSHVEEGGAVEDSPDREAEFEVRFEFHVSQLDRIGHLVGVDRHRSGAEHTGDPAAHPIAAAAVEETVEGDRGRVAVGQSATGVEPPCDGRFFAQHDLAAGAQIDAEILGVLNTENFVVVLAFGRRREEVFQPSDEVARRLPVEPHERGVASRILQLVVVGVASRYSGHELRGVTVAQVEILQFLEKVLIDVAHVDQIQVDGPYGERRVFLVAP